jgi:hypothetical protein
MQELQSPLTFIPQSFAPYDPYVHSAYPFTSIHPSPSNYEYLLNIPVTSYSLPVNSNFREEPNLLNSHFSNGQEQQFTAPSNNYTLSSNSFTNVNNNSNVRGQVNSFGYNI